MVEQKVKAIPEGYHTATPCITVRNGVQAIEFYQKALGAVEKFRMAGPDGKLMHAEIRIGDSVIMLADEDPRMGNKSPQTLGGTSGGLFIYCDDVDQAFNRAVKAGARALMPPTDMFWGDRYARISDPSGHEWALAMHVRDISPEEMQKAQEEWCNQHGQNH